MTTTVEMPFAGAGSASGPGSVTRAVEQALAELDGARPSVVLAFPAPGPDLAQDVALAQSLTAAPIVGMTGNASLFVGGAIENACSVLALADPVRAAVRVETRASEDPRAAGRNAAGAALAAVDSSHGSRVLLMFVDARTGDQAEVITGAYEAAGPSVPLAGGAAGGADPFQIGEGKTYTDAVVAVALVAPGPIGVGIAHGCQPRSAPSIVTKADGRVVLQLDGRRAEDVYLEKLDCADVALSDEEFEAVSVVHPLAQPELSGDVRLRHVLGRTPDGGLVCATHLPANAAVEFTDEEPDGIVVSAWDGVVSALGQLGGARPRAAVIFDCAGRKRALAVHGETLERESHALIASLGDEPPPLAGLYTHGEIGRVRGAKGTATMPWWLSQSAEPTQVDYDAMRRRFVEASRRAEIIAMVNEATSEHDVIDSVCAELCEAFEAEIGFVVIAEARYDLPRFMGSVGLTAQQQAKVLGDPLLAETLQGKEAWGYEGSDLFGIGAKGCALAPFHAEKGERVVVGTVRLYKQGFDEPEIALLDAVTKATGHALERSWLTTERIELVDRLEAAWLGTAEALAAALEAKDSYTADHASSIADLAVEVGEEFGLDEEALRDLRYGAVFHDIGKIAIPDAILNKPGPLTPAEFEVIKRHPIVGEQILAPVPFLEQVRRVVRHDHERWDGGGYPDGLKGRQIPIGARIVLVVDAFHAMISDRSYRKGMSEESARIELRAHAGTQFDPDVVDAFLRVLDRRGGRL